MPDPASAYDGTMGDRLVVLVTVFAAACGGGSNHHSNPDGGGDGGTGSDSGIPPQACASYGFPAQAWPTIQFEPGASVFAHVVTKMRIPQQIVQAVAGADIGIAGFLIAMMVLIFILGMFLESVAIILVTTPVILPVMAQLHVDPIWYGVLLTINLELAQITPPVGMNLFTIRAISNAPLAQIIAGSLPYVLLLIAALAIVMIWPQIALWLPGTMLNLR